MQVHIVQKGDTIWKIAKQHGIKFEELKKLNSHLANPDYIVPGMEIILPEKERMHESSQFKMQESMMWKGEIPYPEAEPGMQIQSMYWQRPYMYPMMYCPHMYHPQQYQMQPCSPMCGYEQQNESTVHHRAFRKM